MIDLSRFKLKYDEECFEEVKRLKNYQLASQYFTSHYFVSEKPQVAGGTEFNDMFSCLEEIKKKLELDINFNLHMNDQEKVIIYSGSLNNDEGIGIEFSKGFLERLSYKEKLFLLAQRIGYYLLEYTRNYFGGIYTRLARQFSQCESLKVINALRIEELGADRIGIFVCEDLASAMSSFYKIEDRDDLITDIETLEKEYHQLELRILGYKKDNYQSELLKAEESTSPLYHIRFKAMSLFQKHGYEIGDNEELINDLTFLTKLTSTKYLDLRENREAIISLVKMFFARIIGISGRNKRSKSEFALLDAIKKQIPASLWNKKFPEIMKIDNFYTAKGLHFEKALEYFRFHHIAQDFAIFTTLMEETMEQYDMVNNESRYFYDRIMREASVPYAVDGHCEPYNYLEFK